MGETFIFSLACLQILLLQNHSVGECFKVENALSLAEGDTFKTTLRLIYDIFNLFSADDTVSVLTKARATSTVQLITSTEKKMPRISIIRPFKRHFCLGFFYLASFSIRQILALDKINPNIIKVWSVHTYTASPMVEHFWVPSKKRSKRILNVKHGTTSANKQSNFSNGKKAKRAMQAIGTGKKYKWTSWFCLFFLCSPTKHVPRIN